MHINIGKTGKVLNPVKFAEALLLTDSSYTCNVSVFPVYRLVYYGYIFIIQQNYISRIGSVIIPLSRTLSIGPRSKHACMEGWPGVKI